MSIPFAFAIAVRTFLASLRLAALIDFALGALPAAADATTAPLFPSCANAANGATATDNATTNPICTIALILHFTMLEMFETCLDSRSNSRVNGGIFCQVGTATAAPSPTQIAFR
ncbi:hypothetical protein [Paraburkholderia sediminicola]|uniref:hypothetical protein n=1 Tax=Paraburkholderia sediminicola TaxID=458836 RepID=UPI0038B916CE